MCSYCVTSSTSVDVIHPLDAHRGRPGERCRRVSPGCPSGIGACAARQWRLVVGRVLVNVVTFALVVETGAIRYRWPFDRRAKRSKRRWPKTSYSRRITRPRGRGRTCPPRAASTSPATGCQPRCSGARTGALSRRRDGPSARSRWLWCLAESARHLRPRRPVIFATTSDDDPLVDGLLRALRRSQPPRVRMNLVGGLAVGELVVQPVSCRSMTRTHIVRVRAPFGCPVSPIILR